MNNQLLSRLRQSFVLAGTLLILFIAGSALLPQGNILSSLVRDTQADERVVNRNAPTRIESKDIDFQLFWQVWDIMKQKSVDRPLSEKKMFYGALRGLVDSLGDPHSTFFEPDTAKKFADDIAGSFSGIGAEIGVRKSQLAIVAPLPDTPASKAGLKAGDFILTINGNDTRNMSLDEAVRQIRGAKGTVVKLMILREGWTKPKEFAITRNTIKVISVRWNMVDKKAFPAGVPFSSIAYVKIASFDAKSVELFRKSVQEIVAKNPKALIVDVRNDPGGLLDAVVDISGEWIEDNLIVTEQLGRDSGSRRSEYRSHGLARLSSVPTVVLINQGSASASEILSGALQDYGKAILIGTKTFGKGSVQELLNLSDGSAMKITVAHWLTPHGRNIDKNGIEPTIKVEITEKDEAAGKDPQMERAIRELSKKK